MKQIELKLNKERNLWYCRGFCSDVGIGYTPAEAISNWLHGQISENHHIELEGKKENYTTDGWEFKKYCDFIMTGKELNEK